MAGWISKIALLSLLAMIEMMAWGSATSSAGPTLKAVRNKARDWAEPPTSMVWFEPRPKPGASLTGKTWTTTLAVSESLSKSRIR